jgi:hypothetical protein
LLINDGEEKGTGGGGGFTTDLSGDDANELFSGDDGGDTGDELTLEQVAEGTPITTDFSGTPPTETTAPAATTPPSVDPNATPNPQPGAQQQPVPGSQPPTPAATPTATQPAVDFEQYVKENSAQLIEQLASSTFTLTDEEKAVVGDAAPIVSKMVSKMYLQTQLGVAQALKSALPGLVANLVTVATQGNETEQKFFSEFPELKAANRQQLAQLGVTLRQQNPKLPAEQFFPLFARTAAAAMGVSLAPVRGQARPHTPASAQQRGATPPRGSKQVVNRDPLGSINTFLRDGE